MATVVAIWLCAGAGAARAEIIDRILAVVGGQPVTLSDVTAARQFKLIEAPAGTADPLAYTLERLIDRTLMLDEVDRFQPPEPDPIEITIRVDALERAAGSAAAFDKALAVTGTTREQLRRHLRDDLRMATYLNQRFGATDPAARTTAIAAWIADLRRRADVSVLRTLR
ncbi:MAG: hypothetical protein ABIQ52_07560 [Vicinamibacterales bacterium]